MKIIGCMARKQDIAAKKGEPEVHKVQQDNTDVVNFIKAKS